jgi:anti-sigma regulatory factor (Ser/Thr protein kinase)
MTLSDVDAKVIRSFEVNSERDKEKYIATIERLRNLKEYLVSLDKASKDQPSLKIVVTEASENFVFHFDKDERHSLKLKTLLVALLD